MPNDIQTFYSTSEEDWWQFNADTPTTNIFAPWGWSSKVNLFSRDKGELGSCLNPYGFVSNLNCPVETPFCNCYKTDSFIPKLEGVPFGAPVDVLQLETLKSKSMECYYIKQVFKKEYKKWFGVDISNSKCFYNCWEPIKSPRLVWQGVSGSTELDAEPSPETPFPYAVRKVFADKDDPNLISTLDYLPDLTGLTANGITSGEYFKYYLEYSKTNATFWNTPKETPLYRKAQTTLLTYQRIKILVNGKFEVKPGMFINIDFITGESRNITNTRFSGVWMVYKVQRIITPGRHSMYLYLMRDGSNINPDAEPVTITTGKGS